MPDHQQATPDAEEQNMRAILAWLAAQGSTASPESVLIPLGMLEASPQPPLPRLKLLEVIFSRFAAGLPEQVSLLQGVKIPLSRPIRQQVQALQGALDKFAQAYESVSKGLPLDTPAEETRFALERAASCLNQHLFISHLVAAPPAPGIWQRLHALLRHSLERWPATAQACPIPSYGEALLLACAQPASFTSEELAFVFSYIQGRGQEVEITALSPSEPGAVFWIDPSRDFPAFALTRRSPPPEYQVFYFSCRPLALQTKSHLQALHAGQLPASLQLPALAASPAGAGALRRLINYWGAPGKRRFPRRRQSRRATLCVGLNRMWQMLQAPDTMAEEDYSQWMVINESPDGYALMHLNGKAGRILVGDVVAVQPENEQGLGNRWQICLVRWVVSENPEHIEIGLQVLSPLAIPAQLLDAHSPLQQVQTPALLLPELPPLRNHPILVTPSGSVDRSQSQLALRIEWTGQKETRQVKPLAIHEQTSQVEMFMIAAETP